MLNWPHAAELARLEPPVQVRLALEELGPTFVKFGQILAGRADLFGPEWIAEFEKLHSHVPALPIDALRPQLREDLGDESMLEDAPDLLRDVIRFNVRAEYLNDENLQQWREELRQDTLVSELYYEASNIGNVGKNMQNMGLIALCLVFLLIFAAVTLIHNTIRLALYSNRFVIKNQELVGASWAFISKPYIQRGVLNGLWSALLSIGALILVFEWIEKQVPEIEQLRDLDSMLMVFIGIILLGVLISGLSTWFVVNKFLRMRIDDLY